MSQARDRDNSPHVRFPAPEGKCPLCEFLHAPAPHPARDPGVRGGAKGDLFAIVFTGHAERRGLYTVASSDNGRTWAAPLRVGPERGWHADVAFTGGVLYAAWDVNSPNGGIGWASSVDGGRTWRDGGQVSRLGLRATHPKLAVANGRVSAFWTERDATGVISWRSAPLSLPAGPSAVR